MRIWVDADACPRVIKDIIFRASERLNIPVCLVANKELTKHNAHLVDSVVVDEGFDVADDYIVDNIATSDLVITADIPLAARIVAGGGIAVGSAGRDLHGGKRGRETLHPGPDDGVAFRRLCAGWASAVQQYRPTALCSIIG